MPKFSAAYVVWKFLHGDLISFNFIVQVLQQFCTVIKLTWIRNTPYIERYISSPRCGLQFVGSESENLFQCVHSI